MTAAGARETQWAEQNARVGSLFAILTASKPSPVPAALANHPAFTRPFNARLVAVGMAATNGHRRLAR